MFKTLLSGLCLILMLVACQPPALKADGAPQFTLEEKQIIYSLSGFPDLPANPSNRYADKADVANFGKHLFYEPRLSQTSKISCATCHDPAKGWADGKTLSEGLKTGRRHSPSLWNTAYQRWYFWDGRADTLWSQALQPMEDPAEMGSHRYQIYQRFQSQPDLKASYQNVFGALPESRLQPPQSDPAQAWKALTVSDQEQVNRFFVSLGKALEAYQRQIVSGQAPFDIFVAGLKEKDESKQAALSLEAQQGLRLFIGRAQCVLCHSSPLFSDQEFHNIGLPAMGGQTDAGRIEGARSVLDSPMNGIGSYSDLADKEDPWSDKLHYLEIQDSNQGEFKTPSLREVATTAPYMHDGRFGDLQQVLGYYNTVAQFTPATGRREDTLIDLKLQPEEIGQLQAFLLSLSSGPPAKDLLLPIPAKTK